MRPLLFIFLTTAAQAQFLPGVDPRVPAAQPVETLPAKVADARDAGTGQLLSSQLREIHLQTRQSGESSEVAPGFHVAADLLLPSPQTLASKLARWNAQALKEGDLVAIADTILAHYDVEGYPVVEIDAPDQDLTKGRLLLIVEIGRVGQVATTRPKYGNPNAVTKGLKLRRGDLVRRRDIDAQMTWLGRNVFRRPQLLVSPGVEPATADLLIGLLEKKPWRATLGYENSGPALLGENRILLGAAGMTPNEHILAWQTVLGTPISSLQANALSWEIPFQRIHQTLQLDAVYARVFTETSSSGLAVENTGTSWSFSAIQKLALPSIGRLRQRLAAGGELKSSDQFVLFGGAPFSPGEVKLLNARINHTISRDWEDGGFSLDTALLGSPGELIAGNDDEDFQVYDPEAVANYGIIRSAGEAWCGISGDWRIALRGSAQATNHRLLPVEQFAAGGYQTVRGVTEREYFADEGWQASLELYAPAVTIKQQYQMRFLIFHDQATLKNIGETSTWISSAGVGMRVKMTDYVDLRLDQGWQLDEQNSQFHIGLQMTY